MSVQNISEMTQDQFALYVTERLRESMPHSGSPLYAPAQLSDLVYRATPPTTEDVRNVFRRQNAEWARNNPITYKMTLLFQAIMPKTGGGQLLFLVAMGTTFVCLPVLAYPLTCACLQMGIGRFIKIIEKA